MNELDWLIVALVALSTLVGLGRGMVRELLALAGWAVAVFLALHFAAPLGAWLPLESLETPLPQFALGQLAYVYRPDLPESTTPMTHARELIDLALHRDLNHRERAKLLESVLRSAHSDLAELFVERWESRGHSAADLARVFRTMFNEVSLSPWTNFADHALSWWNELVERGYFTRAEHVGFLGYLLRQLGRQNLERIASLDFLEQIHDVAQLTELV